MTPINRLCSEHEEGQNSLLNRCENMWKNHVEYVEYVSTRSKSLLMVRQVSKQVLVKKRVSGTEGDAVIQIKTRHNKKKVDTTP